MQIPHTLKTCLPLPCFPDAWLQLEKRCISDRSSVGSTLNCHSEVALLCYEFPAWGSGVPPNLSHHVTVLEWCDLPTLWLLLLFFARWLRGGLHSCWQGSSHWLWSGESSSEGWPQLHVILKPVTSFLTQLFNNYFHTHLYNVVSFRNIPSLKSFIVVLSILMTNTFLTLLFLFYFHSAQQAPHPFTLHFCLISLSPSLSFLSRLVPFLPPL